MPILTSSIQYSIQSTADSNQTGKANKWYLNWELSRWCTRHKRSSFVSWVGKIPWKQHGKSFPRQVDKKSRGAQGERDLEFSKRKKGQTLFPSTFLQFSSVTQSCPTLCFFDDPVDIGHLISGSSAFSKTLNIWKFTVHALLKPGLEKFEHYITSV